MIKAVILDVDGVIVGEKIGVNAPYPNSKVSQRLGDVRNKGIFVSLCTAKPYYSVEKIIRDCKLDNLHITNGGGEITNPLRKIILKKHIVNRLYVKKVLKKYLDNSVYMEFYSIDNYYIQKNQISGISKTHELILQKSPVVVESLINEAEIQDVVKIMAVSEDENDSKRLTEMFAPFLEDLTLS